MMSCWKVCVMRSLEDRVGILSGRTNKKREFFKDRAGKDREFDSRARARRFARNRRAEVWRGRIVLVGPEGQEEEV